MHYSEWGFWGMHVFWWLFWIAIIVALVSPLTPVSRRRRRETPLEVLQRRYAAGEVSTEEYEERKAKLIE
ncbi:MAG: hypothetical protein A3H45_01290 [Ignavibacteria bacterium RIFCSPLOWO2_02_FULL_55_14]|nr:MAG: hypothetical protein A3H45_01290 [Ignavibacteria bacterium RIFCSPLOWO2_02_FULL_55_14]